MSELVDTGVGIDSVLFGMPLAKVLYTANPKKPVLTEVVDGSLSDIYIFLEQWGLWMAACSIVEGVGTVRERQVFFIDDDTAMVIDGHLAKCKMSDPDGDKNFEVLHAVYVARISYRKISARLGIPTGCIRAIADKYAFWLGGVFYEGDRAHKQNIKKILAMCSNKK